MFYVGDSLGRRNRFRDSSFNQAVVIGWKMEKDKKKHFIDTLHNSEIGKIVILNMLSSIDEKLITEKQVHNYLNECLDLFNPSVHDTAAKVLRLMEKTAKDTTTRFLFACEKKCTTINIKAHFVSIMNYNTFRRRLADPKAIYNAKSFGNRRITSAPKGNSEWKTSSESSFIPVKLQQKSWIGRDKEGMFWITDLRELEDLISGLDKSEKATITRNILGLIHHESGAELVALKFESYTIQNMKNARPTFADALGHSRFKVATDSVHRVSPFDEWGYTADLGEFAECGVIRDGLQERVVASISTDDLMTIDHCRIGTVMSTVGKSSSDNNSAFVEGLRLSSSRKLSVGDLRTELGALI